MAEKLLTLRREGEKNKTNKHEIRVHVFPPI